MDTNAERPRWRFTATHAITPRLQAGLEFNPVAGEVGLIGNWIVLTETVRQPLLVAGTSSDRIFSPEGTRATYLTASKSLSPSFAPYIGLSYSQWEDRVLVPFGANVALGAPWDLLLMHDGRNTHLLLTRKFERASVSAIWVKCARLGISVSFGL